MLHFLFELADSMTHAGINEIPTSSGALYINYFTQEHITKICDMLKMFQDNNIVLKMDSKSQLELMMNDAYSQATNPDNSGWATPPDMTLDEVKEALFQYLTFPSPQEEAILVAVNTVLEEVLCTSLEEAIITAIGDTNTFEQEA